MLATSDAPRPPSVAEVGRAVDPAAAEAEEPPARRRIRGERGQRGGVEIGVARDLDLRPLALGAAPDEAARVVADQDLPAAGRQHAFDGAELGRLREVELG